MPMTAATTTTIAMIQTDGTKTPCNVKQNCTEARPLHCCRSTVPTTGYPAWRCLAAICRSRRIFRRSRSDIAPHIPNFSDDTIANSRHSACTEHSRQIPFAVRVDAPRSGKNKSGSAPRQFAKSCHDMSNPSVFNASIRSANTPAPTSCNYNNVIQTTPRAHVNSNVALSEPSRPSLSPGLHGAWAHAGSHSAIM